MPLPSTPMASGVDGAARTDDARARARATRLAFAVGALAGPALVAGLDELARLPVHAWHGFVAAWLCGAAAAALAHLTGARAARWQKASLALPAAVLSLLLPLSMQLPLVLLLAGADGFDGWARFMLLSTGLAHLTLAGMTTWSALRIVAGRPPVALENIYGCTLVASLFPGALVVAPPLVVGVTGIALVPILAKLERVALSDVQGA